MDLEILNQHLDVTSLVTELAFVLHQLDEGSENTVGQVGWHFLAASWTSFNCSSARSADNVTGGTAGHWQVSGEAQTNGTLQGSLHYFRQLVGSAGHLCYFNLRNL